MGIENYESWYACLEGRYGIMKYGRRESISGNLKKQEIHKGQHKAVRGAGLLITRHET